MSSMTLQDSTGHTDRPMKRWLAGEDLSPGYYYPNYVEILQYTELGKSRKLYHRLALLKILRRKMNIPYRTYLQFTLINMINPH